MLITGGLFTPGVFLKKGPPLIVGTPLFNATSENNWAGLTRSGNPAQVGNYLVFTGAESLLSTNIDTSTLSNNDYTYEFWLRTTGTNSGKILSKIGTGGYHVSAVEISNTGLVVGYWTDPQVYTEVSTSVTRDAWQHYTVTYVSDGELTTYYNGQMVDNGTFPTEISPRDYNSPEMWFDLFGLESTSFGNGGALTTDFGEFRFYTRALSAAEVLQNFAATRGRWGI